MSKSEPKAMTEWDAHSHFLALFAATALLKNEVPQSLLLVGRPGEGKSRLVRRFAEWPGHTRVSDLTNDGLRRLLSSNQKLRMICLDEMQRLFSHTFDTVQNVVGLLISLMSGDASAEMVGPSSRGNHVDMSARQLGLLAAIPTDVLGARLQDIEGTGFLSRFSFLSIVRSDIERIRVRGNIYSGNLADLTPYPMPVHMPREPITVRISPEARRELEVWGSKTFASADDRKHVMLTVLVRAHALLCGRPMALVRDVRGLRKFENHLQSLRVSGVASPREIPPLRGGIEWVSN